MPYLIAPLGVLRTPVLRWAERSQQRACRNAMVASTALASARAQRDEVEQYVVTTLAHRAGGTVVPGARTGS